MPTYAYACTECAHRFEIVQAFIDDSLTECPKCDGRLRKLFNAVGVVFKGSGFYRTDSRNDVRRSSTSSSRHGSGSSSDSASGSASSTTSGSSSADSSSASTSSGSSSGGGTTTKTASKSEGSKATSST